MNFIRESTDHLLLDEKIFYPTAMVYYVENFENISDKKKIKIVETTCGVYYRFDDLLVVGSDDEETKQQCDLSVACSGKKVFEGRNTVTCCAKFLVEDVQRRTRTLQMYENLCKRTRSSLVHFIKEKDFGSSVVVKKYMAANSTRALNESIINQYLTSISNAPHENIAEYIETVYDTNEDSYYFITKKYDGPDVFDFIANRQNELKETDAAQIFIKIINGIKFIHNNGVAHGDLSAMNILLDGTDNIRLIDFEMAKYIPLDENRMIPLTTRSGTFKYMSPEMYEQSTDMYDPFANDVWSLGVILFFLLVGCEIYERPSKTDVRFCYLVNGRIREMIKAWGSELSGCAIDLLEKLMQFNPEDRLTIDQVVQHEWFTTNMPPSPTTTPRKSMQRFKLKNFFLF